MMTFMLGLLLGVIICGYPLKNSLELIDRHEQLHGEILDQLTKVLAHMRFVDIRGSFEADDEVGMAFKAIQNSIETLEVYLPKETDEENS